MRAFLSSILLFFYTLTCTGATVYMHQCHEGSLLMLQEHADEHHQTCPICIEHEQEQETSSHACDTAGEDCCKDFKIDLKRGQGQEEIESAPSPFNMMTLSPTTLSILWIVVFQPYLDTQKLTVAPDHSLQAKRSTPTYLLHCNFRI